jgi:hypothetical protein
MDGTTLTYLETGFLVATFRTSPTNYRSIVVNQAHAAQGSITTIATAASGQYVDTGTVVSQSRSTSRKSAGRSRIGSATEPCSPVTAANPAAAG